MSSKEVEEQTETYTQMLLDELANRLTIKFQLNDYQTIAQVYRKTLTVIDIKKDLAKKFRIDAQYLDIWQDNEALVDSLELSEICINDFGIAECVLKLNEKARQYNRNVEMKIDEIALNIEDYYASFTFTELHTILLDTSNNGVPAAKKVLINVINKSIHKPFVGGYIDKISKVVYHDGFSQTGPCITRIKWFGNDSRDCQTAVLVDKADDTHYDRSTQSFGDATRLIHVPSSTDYTIVPKKYETYEEMQMRLNILGKVKIIQRSFRKYLWKKLIKKAAELSRKKFAEEIRREKARQERNRDIFRIEFTIKSFPKSREDFNVLYAEVQKWKLEQLKRINENYSGGPRVAELRCLLEKEIQALNAIEQIRTRQYSEIFEAKQEKFLTKLGEPIKWIGYRNCVVEMDTLRTQKIRFLNQIYRQLKTSMNKEDRLNYLKSVTEALEPDRNRRNVIMILDLVHREEELLKRNVKDSDLEELRQRQMLVFVDYIREHEINKVKLIDTEMCKKCKNVRHLDNFHMNVRMNEVNICASCANLKFPHWDTTVYRGILRAIRRSERQRGALSSFAFIIQEEDIKDLIEQIWHSHSILSQSSIQQELRLPRWNKEYDWSPWNCILLSDKEAYYHTNIVNLEETYSKKLIEKIVEKHFLAKTMFKNLARINYDFVETGKWWNVGLNKSTI